MENPTVASFWDSTDENTIHRTTQSMMKLAEYFLNMNRKYPGVDGTVIMFTKEMFEQASEDEEDEVSIAMTEDMTTLTTDDGLKLLLPRLPRF